MLVNFIQWILRFINKDSPFLSYVESRLSRAGPEALVYVRYNPRRWSEVVET